MLALSRSKRDGGFRTEYKTMRTTQVKVTRQDCGNATSTAKPEKNKTYDGAAQRLDSERLRGVQKRNFATHGRASFGRRCPAFAKVDRLGLVTSPCLPLQSVHAGFLSCSPRRVRSLGAKLSLLGPSFRCCGVPTTKPKRVAGGRRGTAAVSYASRGRRTQTARGQWNPARVKIARLDDFARTHTVPGTAK